MALHCLAHSNQLPINVQKPQYVVDLVYLGAIIGTNKTARRILLLLLVIGSYTKSVYDAASGLAFRG